MYLNNIPINIINENKFKKVMIRFCFFNEYNKENITSYSLLASVLTLSSKKYNDKKKKLDVISDLYNTRLVFSNHYLYNTRITFLTLNLINPHYTNDDNLLSRAIDMMYEFLLNPNVINESFEEKSFEEAKNNLLENLKKEYNSKPYCAYRRINELMFNDEIFSCNPLGTKEELEKITPKDLYKTYLDLINNSKKVIYAIGDCFDDLDKKLNKFNSLYSQNKVFDLVYKGKYDIKKVNIVKEKANIKQAVLILGYRTDISLVDTEIDALEIFVEMFGGITSSNLFRVVREQNGLCYSIEASLENSKKVMFIDVGIEKENFNKTIELINCELEKYQNGEVDKELFEIVKKESIDSTLENNDSFGGIFGLRFDNLLFNRHDTIETIKAKIEKITIDDIINVSHHLKLDTVYLLSEGSDNDDNA